MPFHSSSSRVASSCPPGHHLTERPHGSGRRSPSDGGDDLPDHRAEPGRIRAAVQEQPCQRLLRVEHDEPPGNVGRIEGSPRALLYYLPGNGAGMFGCGDDDEAVSPPQAFREVASDVSAQQPIVITVELNHVLSRLSPRQELCPRCHRSSRISLGLS